MWPRPNRPRPQSRFDPAWRGLWKAAEEVLSSLQHHRSLAAQWPALVDFDRPVWDEVRDDLRRQYLSVAKAGLVTGGIASVQHAASSLLIRVDRLKSPQGIA